MSEGFVYFIEREPGDYVKIGWCKHGPHVRLPELQTGSADLLFIRAYMRGSIDVERRLHRAFDDLRGRGEWFANILKFKDFLDQLDPPGKGHMIEGNVFITQEQFEIAFHDCVMEGKWDPSILIHQSVYEESGDWRPFRNELWNAFGPWED